MPGIIIHQENIVGDPSLLMALCPFAALSCATGGRLELTAACKMCKVCVRQGPEGVFEYREDVLSPVDKARWSGIAVYAEQSAGHLHPVTVELIGKARELARTLGQPVYALLLGTDMRAAAETLLAYGVDEVFLYDSPALAQFLIEPYTTVFADFLRRVRPGTVLVGGTTTGRSLAPRVAARLRSGLTADCTTLAMQQNSDLDQIRPAFGGNIMAHIRTPYHRPQFATVRYKIFSAPPKVEHPHGKITPCFIDDALLSSRMRVLEVRAKPRVRHIEDAEVLIVAGRGVRAAKDMEMINALAEYLGGEVAATRPVIEAGWVDARRQVGLSGRTVSPKLLITCGVSGSIQFVSGMRNAECTVAINTDPAAPIFAVAHYALIGDLYEILPRLLGES